MLFEQQQQTPENITHDHPLFKIANPDSGLHSRSNQMNRNALKKKTRQETAINLTKTK